MNVPLTLEEIKASTRKLNTEMVAGNDNIFAETHQYCGDLLVDLMDSILLKTNLECWQISNEQERGDYDTILKR